MAALYTDRLNGLSGDLAIKAPCRAAATVNITLSGTQTIDGVAVVADDRVLVKNQTSSVDNGIWIVGSGEWVRALDFNGSRDCVGGTMVLVVQGSANGNSYWRVDGIGPKIVATDAITFSSAFVDDSATATYLPAGTGGIATIVQDRLRQEASLWDVIPTAYQAAIIAGNSAVDVTSYINQALQNYRRVIVRKGVYNFSTPILMAYSEQCLEFEDGAWFKATAAVNGICIPHGCLDVKVINPGLIGMATSETVVTAGKTAHAAIIWNSNAAGDAAYGSVTSDDMGGLLEYGRFKGAVPGTSGWNSFIHSNMAGGFTARKCHGRDLYGTSSGYGYGHVFSGDDVSSIDNDFDPNIASQGRHAIYGSFCNNFRIERNKGQDFQSSGIVLNTSTSASNVGGQINDNFLKNVALAADSSATTAGIELNYQGGAASGGGRINVSRNQVIGAGTQGAYIRGYSGVKFSDNTIQWGGNTSGGYAYKGVKIYLSDNAILTNNEVYSAYNVATASHIFVQESRNCQIRGGTLDNQYAGAQRAAIGFDTTGIGTPNAIIDKVRAIISNGGSWSITSGFENPTQNSSSINYFDNLAGSATYDPGNLVDAAGVTTTVTVTGAALGDYVAGVSFSNDLQGITVTGWVSSTDTVSVRFQNETGGALDLASGTLRARVIKA